MDKKTKNALVLFQVNEFTAFKIYQKLASMEKDQQNKQILNSIAQQERHHYETLKQFTGESPSYSKLKFLFFIFCARVLGITFSIKLMESTERKASAAYLVYEDIPELKQISAEEDFHEEQLIKMINEERLEYMGSVVLGLNDALVEFTAALAGFTLALGDAGLIALTGSITGISAALSMGSSEYLSTKSEKTDNKHPVKAAGYTTIAYLITVVALVAPFVLLDNVFISLAVMLVFALIIIAAFNYYYAVAKSENFKKRFFEMAILSFSVASVSFFIGYLLKLFIGVDI